MVSLGICDNHDSGACVVRDGQILAAVNEERLSRKKLIGGFPHLSIAQVLNESGLSPQEIDVVAFASAMTPSFMLRQLDGAYDNIRNGSSSFSYLLNLYIIYQVFAYKLKVPQIIDKWLSGAVIKKRLQQLDIKTRTVCIEHHRAHAAAAYYTSAIDDEALIFTIDAMGDALSVTVNIGRDRHITRIFTQTGFSAVSTYYTRLTEFLGFQHTRHEGKITSLAGYGKPDSELLQIASQQLWFQEKKKGFNFKNHFLKESIHDALHKRLAHYSREDIAYNFQRNFEQEIVKFISFWVRSMNIHNVVLSGGAFANVSLNAKIKEIREVNWLYIFPHMGDGGLALGAALAFLQPAPFYLKNIYLGPDYNTKYIAHLLSTLKLHYTFLEENPLCEKIAQLLYEGKVIAHCNGAMEYGPRALGNRSILYKADDPSCQDWLNDRLKRSHFMPFAPVSLDTEAHDLYLEIDKIMYTLRFMNIAVECTRRMKERSPAGVHVDGTARPQILYREDNSRIYKILESYNKIKGTATLLNTSFNRHEEPIVCAPDDAVKSFFECNLDYLIINNFIIKNNHTEK